MIAFLGSFRFALILIALSAIGVIIGTILESRAESHGIAVEWIYGNPLFHILLGGYFINILLSTLSRRPFKIHHIPFIITHIGLLMIILGVFIKSIFGTQGHMQLIEGSFTDDLILPNERALEVRQKEKIVSIPERELTIKEFYSHAEEHLFGWFKNHAVHLAGFPPLPIRKEPYPIDIGEEESLNVYTIEGKMDDPYVLITEKGIKTRVDFLPFGKTASYIAYDQGFGGYALQAKLPFVSTKRLKEELKTHLESGKPFSPPLELVHHSIEAFVNYLKQWDDEGSFLSDIPFPVNWETVPQNIQNALFWIGELFEEEHLIEHLRKNNWPLIKALENEDEETQIKLWMSQMWALKDDLPSALHTSPRMLSAYLRLYDIHLSTIPHKTITLQTPLFRRIEPKVSPLKKEDREPLALIEFEGEIYPLVYDTKGTRLKTPAANGKYLLNYQPHRIKLPYYVRLHRASDIKYPNSDQTASYECRLTLTAKETGAPLPCPLQMNQVYETPDGYRFYLAGMGQIDPYGVRSVQLVVNRDPAKWILTYPGAFLLSLGIILLFWKNKILSFFY